MADAHDIAQDCDRLLETGDLALLLSNEQAEIHERYRERFEDDLARADFGGVLGRYKWAGRWRG